MPDLQAVIDRHVAALTSAILDAIKQLSVNDIMGLEEAPVARRRPARRGTASSAPTASGASLEDVLRVLSAHQSGMRRSELGAKLGLRPREVARLLRDGLGSDVIVKSGAGGATHYFARSPHPTGAQAQRRAPARSKRARATRSAPSETETSILEHLNEAGPTGSNLKAWIVSTHGELQGSELELREREGSDALAKLEKRGAITRRAGGPARGTVYALAPTT